MAAGRQTPLLLSGHPHSRLPSGGKDRRFKSVRPAVFRREAARGGAGAHPVRLANRARSTSTHSFDDDERTSVGK